MAEDWRLRIDVESEEHGERLGEQLGAVELERDVRDRLGRHIVVSRTGTRMFLYAETEQAAREAGRLVDSLAAEHGGKIESVLQRWDDAAGEWEPVGAAAPESQPATVEAEGEHEPYAEWEVRVSLPSRGDARALAHRLEQEGVPHVRRWSHVLVGTTDEETARAWQERLRTEAPEGSEITVEGTFASIERHNPFAYLSGPISGV